MKNFARSVPGKVIAFILCILMQVVAVASLAGIWYMWEDDYYTSSEEEVLESSLGGVLRGSGLHAAQAYAFDMLRSDGAAPGASGTGAASGTDLAVTEFPDDGNMILQVTDVNGQVLAQSESAGDVSDWAYSYVYARTPYDWGVSWDYYSDGELPEITEAPAAEEPAAAEEAKAE